MSIVPYYPISESVMKLIIKLQLGRIGKRLMENHGATFGWDEAVVNEIGSRCKEVESGARNVDSILTKTVLPDLSGEFLARMAEGASISKVHVRVGDEGKFAYDIS
jgi:type VI secretion system protein VasG